MLNRFFNRLFSILSASSCIQKIKKDEKGICYVTGMRRYMSILIDMIIVVIFLLFFDQIARYFFFNSENSKILNQVAAKYSIQVPLSPEEEKAQQKFLVLLIVNQILQLVALISYVVYMWSRFAATPGKWLFGLRVVDADTLEKMTVKQAIKRFFACILSIAPLFLGFMWAHFSKRCQTWHDKIANTVVITNKSLRQ
ncbi:MAG: RDD family protein [Wolbachia endosymbiont of Tyrophagus putrescentiae]|nr:RDD family protein [Wolbachia endosymbiont of Tyrophagus putrescentiae]